MSMTVTRTTRALAGAIAILLALSCGGGGSTGNDDDGPNQPPPGPPSLAKSVSMVSTNDPYGGGSEQNYFTPNAVNLLAGGTVTWNNATPTAHNVTFSTANAPANIGDLVNGSEARTFPTAGTYAYQCTNHAGMSGTVTVQ